MTNPWQSIPGNDSMVCIPEVLRKTRRPWTNPHIINRVLTEQLVAGFHMNERWHGYGDGVYVVPAGAFRYPKRGIPAGSRRDEHARHRIARAYMQGIIWVHQYNFITFTPEALEHPDVVEAIWKLKD